MKTSAPLFLPFVVELQSYKHYNLKKQHHRVAITLPVGKNPLIRRVLHAPGDLDKPSLTGGKIFSSCVFNGMGRNVYKMVAAKPDIDCGINVMVTNGVNGKKDLPSKMRMTG